MTREDALKLLEQKYNHTYEEEKTYDDFAYCEGKRHGLREAGSIIGMIDKSNKIKSLFDLNKACQWLSNNKDKYILDIEGETIIDEKIVNDFRKVMEE